MASNSSTDSNRTKNSGDSSTTLQEHIIVLLQALHTSLNIKEIVGIFAHSAKQLIPFDSFNYYHEQTQSFYAEGEINHHQAHYKLTIDDKQIGEITLTRHSIFAEGELATLEFLLSLVINPIKNALLYEEMRKTALKDSLTDVGNRLAMEKALHREIEFSRRHQTPLTILMLDLDNFKQLNDELGHLAGDSIIKLAAKKIITCVRDSDVLFRYGGDEFIIILRRTEVAGATQLAERIRKTLNTALGELVTQHLNGENKIMPTTSIGVASLLNGDGAEHLLVRADKALYAAKKLGRNQVSPSY